MKLFDEFRKKKEQHEGIVGGQQRVAQQMRLKTQQQAITALRKHVTDQYMILVPGFWRKISDYLPHPLWYKFWFAVNWLLMLPSKAIHFVCIRGGIAFHGVIWKFGCWSEVDPFSEYVWRLRVYRWFKMVYKCDWDWRTDHPTEVVKDSRKYGRKVDN